MFAKYGTNLWAVGLASVVLFSAAGCTGSPDAGKAGDGGAKGESGKERTNKDKLVGSWFPVKDPDVSIVFDENGKVAFTNDRSKEQKEGTYTLDGDKLTLESKGQGSQTFKVKQLTETALVFEREQSVIRSSRRGETKQEKTEVATEELKKDVSGSDRAKAKADLIAARNSPQALMDDISWAYSLYKDGSEATPSQADDFAPYVENDPRILKALKSGDIVFIYNVKVADMKEGPAKTVVAYTKDTPTKGGVALMGDGKVVKMTADEFKKASLAKPMDK
jgi:uncharacterized protein (TIGR03066 family)